ncbi:Urease accessory protein UreF [Verrucomicrobia bacterium]|nr:Urease accessory protein UreF [Verrucomicrobiota bacterium]
MLTRAQAAPLKETQDQGPPESGPPIRPVPEVLHPDWLLWQLADSAFPTGGFVHSGGLEAAWQHGEVPNRAALERFIWASLGQCGRASVPLMTSAHAHPDLLAELDSFCESFLLNHVANRASRAQGRSLLVAAERIFNAPESLAGGAAKLTAPPCGHLAPVFGAITRRLGIARDDAGRLFLFLHLRGLIAAAVRLGIIGPLEAQTLQNCFAGVAQEIWSRSQGLGLDDLAQISPLLDIWQGTHDRLYSRLFQS